MSEKIDEPIDRAEWQRGEGMLLFSKLTDELLPEIEANISDTDIRERLHFNRRFTEFQRAVSIVELIRDKTSSKMAPKFSSMILEDEGVGERTLNHTFSGHHPFELVKEVRDTVALLPLNIIELAHSKARREKGKLPVYRSLGNIASIMTSEWFSGVTHTAALAANGTWASLSSRPLHAIDVSESAYSFTYESRQGLSTFDFDEQSKQILLESLRNRNKEYRTHGQDHASILDGTVKAGSTAGCPVRHDHVSPAIAPEVVENIAKTYEVTQESLMAPRQTGIDVSLQFVGRLLTRAALIDTKHC